MCVDESGGGSCAFARASLALEERPPPPTLHCSARQAKSFENIGIPSWERLADVLHCYRPQCLGRYLVSSSYKSLLCISIQYFKLIP